MSDNKFLTIRDKEWLKEANEFVKEMLYEQKQELISEIQTDLDSLNPDIPYSYEPLRKLKKKWGKK